MYLETDSHYPCYGLRRQKLQLVVSRQVATVLPTGCQVEQAKGTNIVPVAGSNDARSLLAMDSEGHLVLQKFTRPDWV